MKKIIFIAVFIALSTCGGVQLLHKATVLAYKNTILGEMPTDISKFYGEKHRLPLSWFEFVTWSEKAGTKRHWTTIDLNSRFTLKWGMHITAKDSPDKTKLVVVLEPQIKDIEPYLNQRLYDACNVADRYGSATSSKGNP
jgi:hypothetical protein